MKSISIKDYKKIISKKEKVSKFRNKKIKNEGKIFDSKLEYERYLELKRLEKIKIIKDLVHHKVYELKINNILICKYEADFVYIDNNGIQVVEDTKGVLTKEYKIKKKLMLAINGISILETYKKRG